MLWSYVKSSTLGLFPSIFCERIHEYKLRMMALKWPTQITGRLTKRLLRGTTSDIALRWICLLRTTILNARSSIQISIAQVILRFKQYRCYHRSKDKSVNVFTFYRYIWYWRILALLGRRNCLDMSTDQRDNKSHQEVENDTNHWRVIRSGMENGGLLDGNLRFQWQTFVAFYPCWDIQAFHHSRNLRLSISVCWTNKVQFSRNCF